MKHDLKSLLLKIVDVIIEETEQNPEFKSKLEGVISEYAQDAAENKEIPTGKTTENPPVDPETIITPPEPIDFPPKSLEDIYAQDYGITLAQNLDENKVADLKKIAKERGLKVPTKGKKADYVRLILDDVKKKVTEGQPQEQSTGEEPSKEKDGSGGEKKEEKGQNEGKDSQGENQGEKEGKQGGGESTDKEDPPFDPEKFSPVKVYQDQKEEGLRAILEKRSMKELRTIIRQNAMDPGKITKNWKKEGKLVEHILEMSRLRATQGDTFRNYKY